MARVFSCRTIKISGPEFAPLGPKVAVLPVESVKFAAALLLQLCPRLKFDPKEFLLKAPLLQEDLVRVLSENF